MKNKKKKLLKIESIEEVTELIDSSDFKGLPQITNPMTFDQKGPTVDGLYSEVIFGQSLKDQATKFAYIELGVTIIAPDIYYNLNRLDPIFKKIIDPSFDVKAILVSGMLQESPNGKRGAGWLQSIWDQIDFNKYQKPGLKDSSYQFKELKKEQIFLNKWIVIPPLFRPYIEERGILKEDKITGLYKDILRLTQSTKGQNIYLDKLLDSGSKSELIQLKINELHDHAISLIDKSTGAQEQKLIGKRQDNVARLVANASPRIPLHSVGVPWHYLLGLFDKHVIAEINLSENKEEIYNILELPINTTPQEFGQYFDYIARNVDVFVTGTNGEKKKKKLIEILENIFNKFPELTIMLKRDPAWDKFSYIALNPAIITTNAYHVVTNSMMYKPLGGDSFTTKVCGMIQPIKQNCLIKKEIPSYKAKAQINLINKNNAMTMKSMNHYVEKLLKDSNDRKLSRGN